VKNKYFTDKEVTIRIEPKSKRGSTIILTMFHDDKEVFRRILDSKAFNQFTFVKLSQYQIAKKIKEVKTYEKTKPYK